MKLRVRLFLWVGGIFFLSYWVSLFFENQITDKNLIQASQDLRIQIMADHEMQRKHLEEYLKVALSEDQAKIDALLLRISKHPEFGASLFLDPEPIDLLAPTHSAFIFKNDTALEFIQTTRNGKLTSLFAPMEFPMDEGVRIPIEGKSFSLFFLRKENQTASPFIAIKLPHIRPIPNHFSLLLDEFIDVDTGLEVLFTKEQLPLLKEHFAKIHVFDKDFSSKNIEYQIDFKAFFLRINEAAEYVLTHGQDLAHQEQLTVSSAQFKNLPFANRELVCIGKENERINKRVVQLAEREDQASMLTSLANLYPSNCFGSSPFSSLAPKGIARFPIEGEEIDFTINPRAGTALMSDRAFFDHSLFDDKAYFQAHSSYPTCGAVGSSIALISFPGRDQKTERLFLGNTVHLTSPKDPAHQGYLTVAVDVGEILEDLALSLHQDAFLVHQQRIVGAFSAEGKKITDIEFLQSLSQKFLKSVQGSFEYKGTDYYYIQMTPFELLDLHFVVLEQEKKAFSILNTLDVKSRLVISRIAERMRWIAGGVLLIVLLLLHNVARRITKPISVLAVATEHVASGRFEDIHLPALSSSARHDEMGTLYRSFAKMIQGLKEKEKVQGVLNKVVSPEIAQEILKGSIHLGGEERRVTILFADIRGFTEISAHRSAQEVIGILNACMTKISHVIDAHGGVIDKYVGDEVMALFGAPIAKNESALCALEAALEMVEALTEWNKERESKDLFPIYMGIGIHTGLVVAGNMGAENRLNYTVIGKNVNFASRLCSSAGKMEILISKETLEEPEVKAKILVEEVPLQRLKGFAELFTLYRVKGKKHE